MKYDSKRKGTSSLQQHLDKSCKPTVTAEDGLRQPEITGFATTTTKPIAEQAKSKLIDKCVAYCCKDIRPFVSTEGEGFVEMAQELINIRAAYGCVSAEVILPDHTTVSK